jgi:uncharacterized Zn finger protein
MQISNGTVLKLTNIGNNITDESGNSKKILTITAPSREVEIEVFGTKTTKTINTLLFMKVDGEFKGEVGTEMVYDNTVFRVQTYTADDGSESTWLHVANQPTKVIAEKVTA